MIQDKLNTIILYLCANRTPEIHFHSLHNKWLMVDSTVHGTQVLNICDCSNYYYCQKLLSIIKIGEVDETNNNIVIYIMREQWVDSQ